MAVIKTTYEGYDIDPWKEQRETIRRLHELLYDARALLTGQVSGPAQVNAVVELINLEIGDV